MNLKRFQDYAKSYGYIKILVTQYHYLYMLSNENSETSTVTIPKDIEKATPREQQELLNFIRSTSFSLKNKN